MKTQKESMWMRLTRRVLPKTKPLQSPQNVDANTNTLGRIGDDDPIYKAVVDHAIAALSNELETVLDITLSAETRINAANSASGLQRFLDDLENRRTILVSERERVESALRRGKR